MPDECGAGAQTLAGCSRPAQVETRLISSRSISLVEEQQEHQPGGGAAWLREQLPGWFFTPARSHCVDPVMCLLDEKWEGWVEVGRGLLGCFPESLSATVTQSQPPPPRSPLPLPARSDRQKQKKKGGGRRSIQRGPSLLHQCLTSATSPRCLLPLLHLLHQSISGYFVLQLC